MFDFIKNDVIAGIVNLLVILVPAVVAFFVGLRKYSSKALKIIKLAKESIELLNTICFAFMNESDGGEKLTESEIKGIIKEARDIKNVWDDLKV